MNVSSLFMRFTGKFAYCAGRPVEAPIVECDYSSKRVERIPIMVECPVDVAGLKGIVPA